MEPNGPRSEVVGVPQTEAQRLNDLTATARLMIENRGNPRPSYGMLERNVQLVKDVVEGKGDHTLDEKVDVALAFARVALENPQQH